MVREDTIAAGGCLHNGPAFDTAGGLIPKRNNEGGNTENKPLER